MLHLRQFDAAIRELRVRKEMQPHERPVRALLATAYFDAGRMREYADELSDMVQNVDRDAAGAAELRRAFAAGGERAVDALRLKNGKQYAQTHYFSPLGMAHLYARAGRREETLTELEAALAERSARLVFLQSEPDFDFVHDDPRYRAIVTSIGLPKVP